MKINIMPAVCAALIAGLITFAFHAFGFSLLVTLASGFTLMLSLFAALGLDLKNTHRNANIKIVAWIAVLVFATVNILSGLLKCGSTFVIIANAAILVLVLLIMNKIYHAKM